MGRQALASEPLVRKRCNKCGRNRLAKFYDSRLREDRHDMLAARCRDCVREDWRLKREEEARHKRAVKRGLELPKVNRLPIKPFQSWVEDRLTKYESITEFCEATEMHERRVYDLLRGRQNTVELETVDRALTREGSTMLWELYPDLYP